jgi:hypothetical protein
MLPRIPLVLAAVASGAALSVAPRTISAAASIASAADTVLRIPASSGQPLLCRSRRVAPDSTHPREHIELELQVGRGAGPFPPPRQIFAAFDTAGLPLVLADAMRYDGTNGDDLRSDVVTVLFVAGGRMTGTYKTAIADSGAKARMHAAVGKGFEALRAAGPQPVSRSLSQDEQERAAALMTWLWAHRCEPAPSDSTPRRSL